MIKLLYNLLQIIRVVSKYQIITHSGYVKLPPALKFLGILAQAIFYPIGFFKKPSHDFGRRFSTCLEKLGPIYIKLGQTLSTRPDLIGPEVAESLRYLQDKLPPFSGNIAKKMIEQAFGRATEELFLEFNDVPVAAASISQVHKAKLKSGEYIAVKILRPGIHEIYAKDIKLLYFLARLSTRFITKFKRLKPIAVIDIFNEMMKIELDLRLEGAACSEMKDNFKGDPTICLPNIYWPLTSADIMCAEWLNGTSIYDTQSLLAQGLNLKEITTKIAVMFFNQAYRDGFFHADLHPGNILVSPAGEIILLDFGIMGRLAEKDRMAIAEILHGFLQRDYARVAEVHRQVGYVPKHTNLALFAQTCRAVCEPIVGLPIKEILIGKLLAQLFKITEDFGMETQPQLLLLQKTMVVVEGIGQHLDHDINMWQLAEPWIKKWATKNLSPEAKLLRLIKKIVNEILDKAENR